MRADSVSAYLMCHVVQQSSGGRDGSELLIGPPDMSLAPEGLSWHAILGKVHMWIVHLTALTSGQTGSFATRHAVLAVTMY